MRPNKKWVTDISYIQTGQGMLYLSMNVTYMTKVLSLIKWEQNVNLVLNTIKVAKTKKNHQRVATPQ